MDDVFSEARHVTDYDALTNAWGGFQTESMAAGRNTYIKAMRQACIKPTRCDDARWQRNAEIAKTDMLSFAARQDERRTDVLNDRRYARQYQILKYGRGSFDAMMSYAEIAQTFGLNASRTLLSTVNSALEGYGYYTTRNRTFQGWGGPLRDQWAQVYAPNNNPVVTVKQEPAANIAPVRVEAPKSRTVSDQPLRTLTDLPDDNPDGWVLPVSRSFY